jgi:hypothetical protein
LTYSAIGPVDITRGTLGIGLDSAQSAAGRLRQRYEKGRLAKELATAQEQIAKEIAAAQEVVAGLPQALQEARQPRRQHRKLWLLVGLGALALAGGAVAFATIRRSSRPEPSPRPPSVEVEPKP